MKSSDVLVARLSGAVKTEIMTVRCGKKYFVVAPPKLGGIREVPADSLTDCLHASVHEMSMKMVQEPVEKKRLKA